MTLILDMASGTEYQGEEMRCRKRRDAGTAHTVTARDLEYPQLQLATVEATAPCREYAGIHAGMDIDTLIKSIED